MPDSARANKVKANTEISDKVKFTKNAIIARMWIEMAYPGAWGRVKALQDVADDKATLLYQNFQSEMRELMLTLAKVKLHQPNTPKCRELLKKYEDEINGIKDSWGSKEYTAFTSRLNEAWKLQDNQILLPLHADTRTELAISTDQAEADKFLAEAFDKLDIKQMSDLPSAVGEEF